MLKRAFILSVLITFLTSCAFNYHLKEVSKTAPKLPVKVSVTQRTGEFTKVRVVGKIDVYLHTGVKYNKIVFQGESDDVAHTTRIVNNDELYIEVGKGYPKYGHLKVDIYMHRFTAFTFRGSGNIYAKGVAAKCIDLDIDNNQNTLFDGSFGVSRAKFANIGYTKIRGVRGCVTNLTLTENAKVKLIGYSNVANINMNDRAELKLFWVKSKTLRVQLKGRARAEISGLAENFHAKTWDKSCLDSRHLMSQNSFVKTYNFSEAYISVVKNQHTLANDKSNIYYYFLPETKTDFMAREGSVLDMREWTRPFIRSYTKYNR